MKPGLPTGRIRRARARAVFAGLGGRHALVVATLASLAPEAVALSACASSPASDVAATADLAGAPAPATPQAKYPAFKVKAPIVENLGGPLLRTPRIVPVTFIGDPLADDIERFTSLLGKSDYWTTTTAEYGIGPATSATPIRLAEAAPAATDDDAIRAWLIDKLNGTNVDWPAPDDNTVYAVFYPGQTTVSYAGFQSCETFGAYHYEVKLPSGRTVPYAVLPRCERFMNYALTPLELLTVASSHEIIESVTDPFPDSAPAYLQVASFYGLPLSVAELGDTCNANARINGTVDDAPFKPDGFPYTVQRIWSNNAARAGHNPCVPATGTYFNAEPLTTDTFDATAIQGSTNLAGWKINPGETKTLELDLFSDNPTSGPFTLSVDDLTDLGPGAVSHTKLALDTTSGINGGKVHLSVTVLPGAADYVIFRVTSSLGDEKSYWYGTVETTSFPDGGVGGANGG